MTSSLLKPHLEGFNALAVQSPVGTLSVFENQEQIIAVTWDDRNVDVQSPLLREARDQLEAYFSGRLRFFDLPLNLTGSDFLKTVCREMLKIPYGETSTYGAIAKTLKSSAQPVGGACGRNPIPILIPCHRVMGANDKMTGFSGAGGVATKHQLLAHEGWQPAEPDLFL